MTHWVPDVDWVELGCRGWDVDECGAGLYQGSEDQPFGDPLVCHVHCFCHLDEETLEVSLSGCPAFLKRIQDDLGAAHHPGFPWPWRITTTASNATWATLNG